MSIKKFWNAAEDNCRIGSIIIQRIVDLENVPFSPKLIFPDASLKLIERLAPKVGMRHFSETNLDLLLSFHSYLVRSKKYNILVDTCCGNDKNRAARPAWHQRKGPFLDNLENAGLKPADIDIVLCTHLHADHVGWNTRLINGKWIPTFPNAQYLFAEREYKYWRQENEKHPNEKVMYGSYDDSILPVIKSGQAFLVKSNHVIDNNVRMEAAYGHTPGNVIVHVENESDHAILCGDVIHHPIQLEKPMWSTNFCTDQKLSRETRNNMLQTYANSRTAIIPAHFHSPNYGPIKRDSNSYQLII